MEGLHSKHSAHIPRSKKESNTMPGFEIRAVVPADEVH